MLLFFDAAAILESLMEYSVIGPDEILGEKPFTDPELTWREAKVMRGMLARERERAQAWQEDPGAQVGAQIERRSDQRVVVDQSCAGRFRSDHLRRSDRLRRRPLLARDWHRERPWCSSGRGTRS